MNYISNNCSKETTETKKKNNFQKIYKPLHISKFHLRILSNIINFLSGHILILSIFLFLGHNLQRSDIFGKILLLFNFIILSNSLFANKSNFSEYYIKIKLENSKGLYFWSIEKNKVFWWKSHLMTYIDIYEIHSLCKEWNLIPRTFQSNNTKFISTKL